VRVLFVVSCVAACLVLTAQAVAKTRYLTPPGNSGITQYTEVVPSSGGNTPTAGGPSSSSHLPAAAARALAGPGTARKELSNFVGATAPARARSGHQRFVPAAPSGSSGVASVLRSLGGHGGGMGLVLPLLIVAALLAVIAAIAVGRRRRSGF
jgi:hypothetical protein